MTLPSPKIVPSPFPEIVVWIGALGSEERAEREAARHALVSAGRAAVPALLRMLSDSRTRVRWEATKALVDIADPRTARAFVHLLEDPESGVRWLAAEGLVGLGDEGLPVLLMALESGGHSAYLREGAHHVVSELHEWRLVDLLTPLARALEAPQADVHVPIAACHVLDRMHRLRMPRRVASPVPLRVILRREEM